jgi:hypothetical protein
VSGPPTHIGYGMDALLLDELRDGRRLGPE